MFKGNQGKIKIKQGIAYKKYHDKGVISGSHYFDYEVSNLKKIYPLKGKLYGFQIPVLIDYDSKEMIIKMNAINLNKPFILDFCPMIRDKNVFDKFINLIFKNYLCESHGIIGYHPIINVLRKSLIFLSNRYNIFYTDPKPSNVLLVPIEKEN